MRNSCSWMQAEGSAKCPRQNIVYDLNLNRRPTKLVEFQISAFYEFKAKAHHMASLLSRHLSSVEASLSLSVGCSVRCVINSCAQSRGPIFACAHCMAVVSREQT